MAEFSSFIELLGMLVTDPRTGVLLALLLLAAGSDYRTFRIPNLLTGGGILFALTYNTLVPAEWHADWTWAPAGMLLGFFAMLPMYLIRAMGAGDVKLMAMVGAFLGVSDTAYALLFSVVTAGISAMIYALHKRVLGRMLANAGTVMRGMLWSTVATGTPQLQARGIESVGKLAYGISIAFGTTSFLIARQFNLV